MAGDYSTTTPDGNAVKTQRATLPMSEVTFPEPDGIAFGSIGAETAG